MKEQNQLLVFWAFFVVAIVATPLDDYVNKPDSHYTWSVKDYTLPGSSFHKNLTGYVIEMTSRKWLDETYVNRPVWRHALVVIVPEAVEITQCAGSRTKSASGSTMVPPTIESIQNISKTDRS